MANENKPNTPAVPSKPGAESKSAAPVAPETPRLPALSFETVDAMPEATEIRAVTNPFQAQVNEMAKTGKATRFKCPVKDANWARTMIRNAANNIHKGAKTKVMPIKGDDLDVIIYFTIGEKIARGESK